jgi:hypothetical protein
MINNKNNQLKLFNKEQVTSDLNNIKKIGGINSNVLNFITDLPNSLPIVNNSNNLSINNKNIKNYIKSKTVFNSKIVNFLSLSNNYYFNKYNQISSPIKNSIFEFLSITFKTMFALISQPVFINTPDKVIIQLFYFVLKFDLKINNANFILKNKTKLKAICNILSRFFQKPIELELIRLYYPYYNSNILVNLFGILINKIKLRRILNKFIIKSIENKLVINKSLIPSALSGIKIKVAGRLLTQRIVPRMSVKTFTYGSTSRNKSMFLDTARFTSKNKRGAFSLTISLGHKFNNSV